MKYVLILICALCLRQMALAQAIAATTETVNAHEKGLQRIVLPQFHKFNGQPIDDYALFHWLELEAQAHDPAPVKVRFSIVLTPGSNTVSNNHLTPTFLTSTSNAGSITLPDAVKYYASLCGLIYDFKPNTVEIRKPQE